MHECYKVLNDPCHTHFLVLSARQTPKMAPKIRLIRRTRYYVKLIL